jgi:4-hydroxyphenylacetate 3-hydroxylase C terminal
MPTDVSAAFEELARRLRTLPDETAAQGAHRISIDACLRSPGRRARSTSCSPGHASSILSRSPRRRRKAGGEPSRCAWIFPHISEWAHWSILARIAVKAEVLVGLYAVIPEMMGRSQQPHAQEAIAEAIRYLITLRAFIHASEDQGTVTSAGYYMPNPTYVTAVRAYSVEHYRRIAGYLHDIGGQSLINMASEKSFDSPDVGPSLEKIFSNRAASARDRARVTRLGWDMVCDSFGARQTLFELFNAAPWTAQRAQLPAEFDLAPYRRLALATAGIGSLEEAAAAMFMAAHTKDRNYEAAATSFKGVRR